MKIRYFLTVCLVVICSGCHQIVRIPIEEPRGHYYLDAGSQFNTVSRVALLEPDNHTPRPELSDLLAQSLAAELGKKHLFSLTRIERSDPLWTSLNLDRVNDFSFEDLAMIQQQLNVDAIIYGTIKRYESFPRMMMGLNLKMVDMREGSLLWAIEQVWDSTDKQVELRMKRFYSNELRVGYEPLNWQVLSTSPRAFNKFVAFEVAQTLPELSSSAAAASPSQNQRQYILNVDLVNPFQVVRNY